MRVLRAIVQREIQAYFVSPIAYAALVVFLLFSGSGFTRFLVQYASRAPMYFALGDVTFHGDVVTRLMDWMSLGAILCLPPMGMRLFSEERKSGTIELLLTSPIHTGQLVLGKYFGTLAVYAVGLVLTIPFMIAYGIVGEVDWPAAALGYLGLLGFGGVLVAISLFSSSFTENQIVSVVLTYALFLPFLFLDLVVSAVPVQVGDLLASLSVTRAAQAMALGILDTHFLLLFTGLSGLFLFLSAQVLDSTRWR